MPRAHEKRFYPVVSATIVALCGIGMLARLAQPKLPPPPPNRLAAEPAEFLIAGSRQQIDWLPWGEEVFETAKQSKKPIMLVIGAMWSYAAREADRTVFLDSDVTAFLSSHFTCTRVDAQVQPEFLSAFLPFQRTRLTTDPGFLVVFLDSGGRVFRVLTGLGVAVTLHPSGFLQQLQESRGYLESISRPESPEAPGLQQARDASTLLIQGQSLLPDLAIQDEAIRVNGTPKQGGFVRLDHSFLWPHALRYLLYTGRMENLKELLDPILTGRHVDWLDGGFFRAVRYGGRRVTWFDKIATENAEMMLLLSEIAALEDNDFYRRIASDTFRSLSDEFALRTGFAGARLGDESLSGRSERSSFSVAEILERLTPEERGLAQSLLEMRVESNPMMQPVCENPENVGTEGFERILAKLRSLHPKNRRFLPAHRDSNLPYVIARMIRSANMLDDARLFARASELRDFALGQLLGGDIVSREGVHRPSFAAYLGFADMELQWFLATGEGRAAQSALRLLDRAKFLFESPTPGVFRAGLQSDSLANIPDANLPEVRDGNRESSTAQFIRVAATLGKIFRKHDDASLVKMGRSLDQAAVSAVAHFTGANKNLAFEGSAYFSNSLLVADDIQLICVGSGAVRVANRIRRAFPGRVVYAASKVVSPSLAGKKPGVYMGVGTNLDGPMGEEEAMIKFATRIRERLGELLTAKATP